MFKYHSNKYPNLTLHHPDKSGKVLARFSNGVYETKNAKKAALLEKHPDLTRAPDSEVPPQIEEETSEEENEDNNEEENEEENEDNQDNNIEKPKKSKKNR